MCNWERKTSVWLSIRIPVPLHPFAAFISASVRPSTRASRP